MDLRAKTAKDQTPDIVLSWSHIETVRDSYCAAIEDGQLKYRSMPKLDSDSPVWNPYILSPAIIRHAVLDKDRVNKITQRIQSTTLIVPKAVEWTARTREYSLTPANVKGILQKAFVGHESSPKPQPEQIDEPLPILEIAAKALCRAKELEHERGTYRREVAILRMVAYASMEVSMVAKEATAKQVCAV